MAKTPEELTHKGGKRDGKKENKSPKNVIPGEQAVYITKKKNPQMMSTATSQWWELIFFNVLWT